MQFHRMDKICLELPSAIINKLNKNSSFIEVSMYLVFTTNKLSHSYFYIPVPGKPCNHFNVKVMDLYPRGGLQSWTNSMKN